MRTLLNMLLCLLLSGRGATVAAQPTKDSYTSYNQRVFVSGADRGSSCYRLTRFTVLCLKNRPVLLNYDRASHRIGIHLSRSFNRDSSFRYEDYRLDDLDPTENYISFCYLKDSSLYAIIFRFEGAFAIFLIYNPDEYLL